MVAKDNNATCSICGRSYHKCLSCRDSMKLQPWRMFTDTANCYKVFQAVRGLNIGIYNKDEFKSKLKNIDLSDLESYEESIKVLIKGILQEDEAVVKVVEQTEPIDKTDESVEDVVENVESIEEVIKKVETTMPRKRNYNINKIKVNEEVETE